MSANTIPERDLPAALPGPDDYVRGTQSGRSVRFPAGSLPVPIGVSSELSAIRTSLDGNIESMDSRIDSVEKSQAAGMIGFATRAAMDSDIAHPEGTIAQVTNDPDAAKNGAYRKAGGSGAGSWIASTDRTSALQKKVDSAIVGSTVESTRVPLFVDSEGAVPLWLIDGLLGANGFSGDLLEKLGFSGSFAPASQPLTSSLPRSTDGRSLWAWRGKIAQLRREQSVRARVVLTGDSWAEFLPIPAALTDIITAGGLPRTGLGWINVSGAHMADGVIVAHAGFTLFDPSAGGTPTYGTGIDGHYLSTSGATATLSISNCKCTDFRLYYRKHGGTFRWRVDGGAWTTVVSDGSGGLGITAAGALSDAQHHFEFDTTGNGGNVVICGAMASSGAPGVEVVKGGNSGLDGSQLSKFAESISGIVADIAPDAVIVILGTNDYRRVDTSVAKYKQGLADLVAAYRSAVPGCGFIFVAPADSSGVAIEPLTDYRDAAYRFAIEHGHEFYNMHDEWPGHAEANAAGLWLDSLHLNDSGARVLAARLYKILLED